MPEISLTDFVDFVAKSGTPKLTKVRQVKERGEYDPVQDFWKPLREGIVEFHKKGDEDKGVLDGVVRTVSDHKKSLRYQSAIAGYKRFLGRKRLSWFDPPRALWVKAGLEVRVNPELGLVVNDEKHIIKLYFKDDQLQKRKTDVVIALMQVSLELPQGGRAAILEVSTGKLYSSPGDLGHLLPLLAGEAASFAAMWSAL